VEGAQHDVFDDTDLQTAASYYSVLQNLCSSRGRLNDALILTLTGCWSHSWQAALISHAAAAEALLPYSTKPVPQTQAPLRDAAYQEFRSLYSIRSDIMHGRTNNVPSADRLPILARFQDALRQLWRVILRSQPLVAVLEGTDTQREAHFLALEAAYSPPR
jgi:hypothetical protein